MSGNRYCSCSDPSSCTSNLTIEDENPTQDENTNATQDNSSTELDVALAVLMLWLKLVA
jgi:hypothetical protein